MRLTNEQLHAIRERAEKATAYDEEWRPIRGTEGLYEVSDFGNVRSKLKAGNHRNKVGNPRLLKLRDNSAGYHCVSLPLGENGKYVTKLVHRLVAETFIGQKPEGLETAHLNGDKKDNRLVNLKYVTHRENESHKIKHGTSPLGENNGQSKLLGWQVEISRYLANKGIPQIKIAKMFDWHPATTSEIIVGDRWKHIKPYEDIPSLLSLVAQQQAEIERSHAESEYWRMEHEHQRKQAETYREKYLDRQVEIERMRESLERITDGEVDSLGDAFRVSQEATTNDRP